MDAGQRTGVAYLRRTQAAKPLLDRCTGFPEDLYPTRYEVQPLAEEGIEVDQPDARFIQYR